MTIRNQMRPVLPGEVLQDEIEALDMSATEFAAALDVPTNRITAVLNGDRAITTSNAIYRRLGRRSHPHASYMEQGSFCQQSSRFTD